MSGLGQSFGYNIAYVVEFKVGPDPPGRNLLLTSPKSKEAVIEFNTSPIHLAYAVSTLGTFRTGGSFAHLDYERQKSLL